ncbi:hypothetical protein JQK88_33835 [Mesorhizobium caraganae]|uniref:hypothetical protein n=1 Tax=Mesorhizobium caraganae TaxID=483206 RepID=UPI0017832ED3|nr:hypothetical protein [Mesorhizobium caraganae]MBM2716065.1 hypothetical protein [Mesorhizobium caraganae]
MSLAFPCTATPLCRASAWPYGSPERDCLEVLIMTGPGERLTRPTFRSPVREMLFAAGNGLVALALEAAVEAVTLGQLLTLRNPLVDFDDAAAILQIKLNYDVKATGQAVNLSLSKGLS